MSATTTLRLILLGEDKSAGKSLRGVGDDADRTSKKMQTFHKVGAAAGVALAGGLALAGAAAVKATRAASEDEAAASKLAQTLHRAAGATDSQVASTESWITAQGKSLGVTDDELRPALSKLAIATGSVSKAQDLSSLAMDIAAARGLSLASVSQALAKAQKGNIAGLSRLGIATKDAAGNTLTLDQVTKQMAATYTGAAATAAETTAGKQKILTTQMQELQEQIGYGLLPVMTKLVTVGLTVVNWISNNTTVAGVLVGVIGGLVAVTWAVSAATKAYFAITKLAAAGQWLLNAAMTANPIGLVVVAIAALVVALVIAYKKSETFRTIVQASFHGVLTAATAVFGWIKSHWPLLFAILGGPVGLATVAIIKNFDKVQAALKAAGKVAIWLWNGAFQPALQFIVRGIGFMVGVWGHMLSALGHVPGFGWAKDAGTALLNASEKARALADNINKIPTHKTSTVVLNVVHNVVHTTGGHVPAPEGAGASGAIVRRPTIALIGESGPEALVPLSSTRGNTALGLGGGGNVYVTITGALDPIAVGKQVEQALAKVKRTRGGGALAFQ